MKRLILAMLAIVLLGLVARLVVGQPVEEVCDGDPDQLKRFQGMRPVPCPEGFVGMWFQERAAGTCEWKPQSPQWYACSQGVEPIEVPSEVPPTPMN